MYFIHNRYDASSTEMLKSLSANTVVIDLFTERDAGNYLDLKVSELPALVEELEYDTPESENEFEVIPKPTDIQLIMQSISDLELKSFEEQKGQEMLAQQMTDIELSLIERSV